jgi:hypothetical protein
MRQTTAPCRTPGSADGPSVPSPTVSTSSSSPLSPYEIVPDSVNADAPVNVTSFA